MDNNNSEDSRTRRKSQPRPPLINRIRTVTLGIWLLVTLTLGVMFFHIVPYLFILAFLRPLLYRKLMDELLGSWLIFCAGLLEYWLGIKVVITGDEMLPNECGLVIMNHRTRLDWMYFWCVAVRHAGIKTRRIILKSPLKKIPGAGWAMQAGAFIFINRNWESDKKTLSKMLNYFSGAKNNTQVLLFPEGTDLTSRTRVRSDEFARRNDWEPYNYCLHPRTTGFTYLTQLMKQNNQMDAVYDVTIAYPYNFPQTEPELITGNIPKEVHFHVKRHPIETLPADDEGLKHWCQTQWQEKEKRLEQFHKDKKFMTTSKPSHQVGHRQRPERTLLIAIVYWTIFVLGILVILWHSALARWLSLVQCVFFIYMGHFYGGFEIFQADYFNWFFKSSHKQKDN